MLISDTETEWMGMVSELFSNTHAIITLEIELLLFYIFSLKGPTGTLAGGCLYA